MPNKKYNPTSPARRYLTVSDFSTLTKKKPEKRLCSVLQKKAGRNNTGKITIRHRGGGRKRLYRLVDFSRKNFNLTAEVLALEYDPNRSAHIMLVQYESGKKSYYLAPEGIKVGDKVVSSEAKVEAKTGNRMPLEHIPDGNTVYNIELVPGAGGKMAKSAGSSAVLMITDAGFAQLRLPSGEVRTVSQKCLASVGQLSNTEHGNVVIGKAGRVRLMGRRPHVRGKAMNPVDHPHGGGEGRAPIGMVHPKTPWGKPALGVKTRKKNKKSNASIIRKKKGRKR
ncbi:50S ribosomal protein L2 [Patescibacteria group bacterium]|nr:50S ribosomal protein L2 [Patescibacteria group bacterium]